MENFIFLKTEYSDFRLLGRSAAEFTLGGVGAREPAIAETSLEAYERMSEGAEDINIALTLDMPLVTREAIDLLIRRMKAKKIGYLGLGGKDSPCFICFGRQPNSGIFVRDEAFFRIVDTKSACMVYNLKREQIVRRFVDEGAFIPFGDSVTIDDAAHIAAGATILPFCHIEGDSVIEGVVSHSHIINSHVEKGARVEESYLCDSHVASGASVGPFARLRCASVGENCRVGDFVEIKSSTLGAGVKAAHLAYIGDAEVGDGTNVGCGAVFCNYDGAKKHRTFVGKGCFIGANTNLVAPLRVGDGAYIAAGTTVTRDLEGGSFTIGRVRQDTKHRAT